MRAVNLIPAEQRIGAGMGAGSSEGAAYAVIAVIGGVALLAFLYARADHQISTRRSQAATLTTQIQRAQAEASQLAPYTSFAQLRQQRMQAVSQLVDSRFDWAHVFHEFGRVLPAEVSVSTLTGTVGAPAAGGASGATAPAAAAPAAAGSTPTAGSASTVTSATPPGSVPLFSLTGCATSQPAVALMLDRLRLMDGVSSVTLQSSTRSAAGAGTSGGGGGGGCVGGEPAFTVQVAFDGLPTPSATTSAGGTAAASATTTGGAR
jgi:Tfp pilus assembly protein PilN